MGYATLFSPHPSHTWYSYIHSRPRTPLCFSLSRNSSLLAGTTMRLLASAHGGSDDGDGGDDADGGNGPGQDLNDLDLVAFAQAGHDLALELVGAVGYALVGAFDVAPHVVDYDA